jgi:hypothetical protein
LEVERKRERGREGERERERWGWIEVRVPHIKFSDPLPYLLVGVMTLYPTVK